MNTISPCICTNMRRAAQAATQYYDTVMAPSGLKVTQFSLLREIQQREPVSISELAKVVGLDRTTMGKNLQVLARAGLVSLSPGEDRRERTVRVTEEGMRAFEAAVPLWEHAQQTIRDALGPEQLAAFTSLLSTVEAVAD